MYEMSDRNQRPYNESDRKYVVNEILKDEVIVDDFLQGLEDFKAGRGIVLEKGQRPTRPYKAR